MRPTRRSRQDARSRPLFDVRWQERERNTRRPRLSCTPIELPRGRRGGTTGSTAGDRRSAKPRRTRARRARSATRQPRESTGSNPCRPRRERRSTPDTSGPRRLPALVRHSRCGLVGALGRTVFRQRTPLTSWAGHGAAATRARWARRGELGALLGPRLGQAGAGRAAPTGDATEPGPASERAKDRSAAIRAQRAWGPRSNPRKALASVSIELCFFLRAEK